MVLMVVVLLLLLPRGYLLAAPSSIFSLASAGRAAGVAGGGRGGSRMGMGGSGGVTPVRSAHPPPPRILRHTRRAVGLTLRRPRPPKQCHFLGAAALAAGEIWKRSQVKTKHHSLRASGARERSGGDGQTQRRQINHGGGGGGQPRANPTECARVRAGARAGSVPSE
ncbi:unnamed protein product [Lampetra fluviatilis]